MKAQLKNFAIDIVPECSIPEIGFTCEGDMPTYTELFQ